MVGVYRGVNFFKKFRVRVMIRVSFLFRPITESIPECAEYILVTLRSAVLKFRTNAFKRFRIGETGVKKENVYLIYRNQAYCKH